MNFYEKTVHSAPAGLQCIAVETQNFRDQVMKWPDYFEKIYGNDIKHEVDCIGETCTIPFPTYPTFIVKYKPGNYNETQNRIDIESHSKCR
jgi:hypothetical protein